MAIKKITIAGGGILGSQIAYQAAYCGYDVTIWLRNEESVKRTKAKIDNLRQIYDATINYVNLSSNYSNRTVFQIRYAEGSPLCAALKNIFAFSYKEISSKAVKKNVKTKSFLNQSK